MRRCLAALLAAALLAVSLPSLVAAAKPPAPAITSITITADGGTWPLCRQIASVGYRTSHRSMTINVMPWATNEASGRTENNMATVRGTGIVAIAIENDYTPLWNTPEWTWRTMAWYGPRTLGPFLTSPSHIFDGACPVEGIILGTWSP